MTKPDGTTDEIVVTAEGGGVGSHIPITDHVVLDATPYSYRTQNSYSSYITEQTSSSTYTVNMTGHGLVKEAESSWKFNASVAGYSLLLEYKSSGTVSFPMTEVTGSKSLTVGITESRPDSYQCEHNECELMLPRQDYHFRVCKEKVNGLWGERDCDRSYYICQSSTCDRPGEHLVTGGCGERYPQKEASDHAAYTIPCSEEYTDSGGVRVVCYATEAFICQHVHFFRPSSSSGSDTGSDSIGSTPSTPSTESSDDAVTPGIPRSLSASPGPSRWTVSLSWTAPSSDGGAGITGYRYQYRRYYAGTWGPWSSWESTSTTSTTVTGLISNGTYKFRVRAVNSVGVGDPTSSVTTQAE